MDGRLTGPEGEACARRAIQHLSDWELPLSPQNYEISVTHILGENGELTAEIDAILEAGRAPTDSEFSDIYDRHFDHKRLSDEVVKVGGAMSAELATVVRRLEEAGRNTAAYERALAGASDKIEGVTDAETLQTMVSALVDATRNMQRHSATLEQRLLETKEEVSQLRSNLETMREEAMTDALTGVANRKRMEEELAKAIAAADQEGSPLAVAVCDIDHFKRFNDTWGHQTGDQIIKFVASCLTRCAGAANLVARYGGEEFVIIMPRSGMGDAMEIAEQVRAMVESKRLLRKSTSEDLGHISISIGVAAHQAGEHPASVIAEADSRLYESKRNGRNRVTGAPAAKPDSQAA